MESYKAYYKCDICGLTAEVDQERDAHEKLRKQLLKDGWLFLDTLRLDLFDTCPCSTLLRGTHYCGKNCFDKAVKQHLADHNYRGKKK